MHLYNLFYPWFFLGEFKTSIVNTISDTELMIAEKNELLRLFYDLNSIEISNYKKIYINIGSNSLDTFGIYRQFPLCMENNDGKTLVILIDNFKTLPAILECVNATETNYNTFSCEKADFKIYNTFFPTFLNINKYKNKFKDKKLFSKILENQTKSDDQSFVLNFYKILKSFISRAPCYVYIVSTATFSENSAIENSGNINLEMFSEILDLINTNKFILFVWPYNSYYFYFYGTRVRIDYTQCTNIPSNVKNTKYSLGNIYKMLTINEIC